MSERSVKNACNHDDAERLAIEIDGNIAFDFDDPGNSAIEFTSDGDDTSVSSLEATEERDVASDDRPPRVMGGHRQKWTEHDDACLAMSWGTHTVAAVARELGRKPDAVYRRAGLLGLGRGAPQGFESIGAAARRTGFYDDQLVTILRWAHVHIRPAASRPSGKNNRHIVEPSDVDAAVARWLSMETLNDAARRVGRSARMLRAAIKAAAARGEIDTTRLRSVHGPWRMPPETVDAIVAATWGTPKTDDIAVTKTTEEDTAS